MIEIKKLCKSFGEKAVLNDLSLKIGEGSVLGLIGINGAGKSTLLRLMCGVYRADKGEVLFDGENVFENEKVKKQIFFLSDDPYYNVNVTIKQIAELYSTFYPLDKKVFGEYIKDFALDEKKPVRNFSKGMRRQAFLSVALACKPKYLLFDEVFDGLDPLARLKLKRGIIELQQKGTTVVIASHSLRELEDISDCFALLDGGTFALHGAIDEECLKLSKFQLVFEKPVAREDFPFPLLRYECTGRVIKITARGDKDEILEKVQAMHPLIIDEIPVDFEELFIDEVTEKGYLQ